MNIEPGLSLFLFLFLFLALKNSGPNMLDMTPTNDKNQKIYLGALNICMKDLQVF